MHGKKRDYFSTMSPEEFFFYCFMYSRSVMRMLGQTFLPVGSSLLLLYIFDEVPLESSVYIACTNFGPKVRAAQLRMMSTPVFCL